MKVAIYGQFYHKNSGASIESLLKYLLKKKIDVYIERTFSKLIHAELNSNAAFCEFGVFDSLDASFSLLISIGGDGTILRAITHVKDLEIPIVGINTGRLGFLATIQHEEIDTALDAILAGQYRLSKRSLLAIETNPPTETFDELNFALNEIAVSRKDTTAMITVDTKLNGEHLTSYWSDGLIISTPTGSTGYSLSCGGPVITPDTNSFVITPIAPHNLNARPLVITDSTKIELKVNGREDHFLVSLDSRIATLHNDTILTIKKASFSINMIELTNERFLDTLRKKLLWGEDKRN
ncbi:NAD kinase [Mangrovimonas aestuarii]|uniref:NAD kinase n=1 Tax=Mangrovimonas aestuarii TaxID=3018443 RepID=UPI0023797EE2|nr:NAD kinase [Mangrovimonas aestuarii]